MENSESRDYSGSCRGKKSSQRIRLPHYAQPDYSRPLLEITGQERESMKGRLRFLYGEAEAESAMAFSMFLPVTSPFLKK